MTDWEEIKRAGQTAFIGFNGLATLPESIGDLYRQILATGYVHLAMGPESLTQQIVEGYFEQLDMRRVREREQDIELER